MNKLSLTVEPQVMNTEAKIEKNLVSDHKVIF